MSSMNIFRVSGDMSHLLAIMLLLLQLRKARNARGISVKTQELRLLVFTTRYLDLFTTFFSWYNSILKVVYIVVTAAIILQIKYTEPIRSVYNADQDSFPHWKLAVAPCAALAILTHLMGSGVRFFSVMELLWTFSIYLEAIAILPQLMVLQKYRLVENLTGKFIFFLGMYRFLYILNWIYRLNFERRYRPHYLVYVCGVVQTLLYADFFYQYLRTLQCCRRHGEDGRDHDGGGGDIDEDTTGLLLFEMPNGSGGDDATTRRGKPNNEAAREPLI